jgi:hypothetical protein
VAQIAATRPPLLTAFAIRDWRVVTFRDVVPYRSKAAVFITALRDEGLHRFFSGKTKFTINASTTTTDGSIR